MIYTFLANGLEEVECLAVVDILRRAKEEVKLVSVTGAREVTGSHQITIKADALIEDVDFTQADLLFLPGGMPGTVNLGNCELLCRQLQAFAAEGKRLAAICAAPSVLGQLGILKGKAATCYPGFEEKLTGATVTTAGVVTDGNVTTAKGLGVALELGLELVKLLQGAEQSEGIRASIQYPDFV
ncbi:MAG: DJ-1/PfpI family protein [Lachnospiraceae bacterium]|nr:DJ-1/PfpI family protein [Lachnospiraceae bacterium]